MENTIAQKLDALAKLQSIDSQLDEIAMIRGALPYEVMDLEDEIAGYQTRITKFESEIQEVENSITHNKEAIKNSEKLIQKYTEQQMNVRNNREYDAITKEIELQQLEIQICEKRIKEGYTTLEEKKESINGTIATLNERQKDLDSKKGELNVISSESQEEENKLIKSREKAVKAIDDRLLKSYTKIRNNAKNRLAVVSIKRGACGGCFNVVPPQRQAEVREKKKLIVCEHCGRILVDVEDVIEDPEKDKKKKKTSRSAREAKVEKPELNEYAGVQENNELATIPEKREKTVKAVRTSPAPKTRTEKAAAPKVKAAKPAKPAKPAKASSAKVKSTKTPKAKKAPATKAKTAKTSKASKTPAKKTKSTPASKSKKSLKKSKK